MPKVDEEYFENKRKIILNAAMRVFQRKPAYSVTMKDIVNESGLSQGGVYKYYSNIDEIVVALLNTITVPVKPKELLDKYSNDPEKAIFELFNAFRKFFFITAKEFGKIMFELQPMFFNKMERLKILKDNINKDIILNSISHLTERTDTITIRKDDDSETYTVTAQQNLIIKIIIFSIPIIIIAIGIVVWIVRRRKR